MEKNLDNELYNDYLDGKKEAFEYLYNKYKGKIEYFIYNIVKDYQKAEDIMQETFIYVMQKRKKENSSFKYYLYLVARSKAYNYINSEKRRNEIKEKYFDKECEDIEKDILDYITEEETKKELFSSINELDEKYKNSIYLTSIEGLSYEETSKILGQTLQSTKNNIHRGKKQLRKILLKKGFRDMNKVVKVIIIIMCLTISLTGISFAVYNNLIKKQNKVETRGLFEDGKGYSNYEVNLMENDMTWQSDVRLYYKAIVNQEDYAKYKERISNFPETSEIDFSKNFILIIANENIRTYDEQDMEISDIYVKDSSTNVVMKQKENPNLKDTSNVWYVIADKSLLKENIKIIIEHKKFNYVNSKNIEELSSDYSIEDAIKDGCFTLKNNKIVSSNKNQIDEFIEKTEKGESAFIRIYSNYVGTNINEISVKDVNYENGIYYVDSISLLNGKKYHATYTDLKKSNIKNGDYIDEVYLFSDKNDQYREVELAIIQDWLEDYKNNLK